MRTDEGSANLPKAQPPSPSFAPARKPDLSPSGNILSETKFRFLLALSILFTTLILTATLAQCGTVTASSKPARMALCLVLAAVEASRGADKACRCLQKRLICSTTHKSVLTANKEAIAACLLHTMMLGGLSYPWCRFNKTVTELGKIYYLSL